MKRLFIILSMAGSVLAVARPVTNMNGRSSKAYDNRAIMFANTCSPASQSADLDINNVRTKILNGGDMWWDLNNPKYEVPKVTDPNAVRKHSLFSGAIWIGGKDNGGNLKLAAMTYRQRGSDFWPGPLDLSTTSTDPGRCEAYDKMWKVTRDELEAAEASNWTDISSSIREWPAGKDRTIKSGNESDDMAPFFSPTGGIDYNPSQGDYPVLDNTRDPLDNGVDKQPDMFIWWVYNDKGNIHSETQGQAIGVECQTTAFAFATNDEVNNMTFYTTKIFNRGFTKLSDCYMGQWVDADLGNYADDYVGCDVGRSLGYCYNGDDNDEGVLGYGLNPPSIGVDYFEGPKKDDTVELGLSHFMYYNNDQNAITGNPDVANEYYNLLQGKWLGGQAVTFGGTGLGGSRPTKYMFAAQTDPEFPSECWDEKSSGNPPADRRFLQSTGPFDLKPGSVQKITVGVVWARSTSGGAGAPCLGTGSLGLLQLASDKAQTLFNNNFKILDGPDAPDVEIQELEQQLVLKMINTQSEKVESYQEVYKDAQNKVKTYKFEGYLVYQLKDGTVNTGDLENVDKARLLYQCDVKNNRGQIINRIFDPVVNALIPVEKVAGSDAGITHSLNITQDLFATTANTDLINFKTYHYMVLSYAIIADDPAQIDPTQFLAGRRNIKVYRGIPHKTEPELFGTNLNSGYGSGPQLTRLEGRGNGGNVLEFTDATIQQILKDNFAPNPVYIGGSGPVKVKVIDPIKVPKANFELIFRERRVASANELKDSMSANTYWILVNKTTGDSIYSDTTLNYKFETIQGKRVASNPTQNTLADWGLSIEIMQVKNPGEDVSGEPLNGLISWSVDWEDNGKQWLTALVDNNTQAQTNSNSKWQNWIRSGQNGRGSTPFNGLIHSFFRTLSPSLSEPLDPTSAYEGIWNGRIAPYALAAREKYTNGDNTYGPAWSGNGPLDNPLGELASIQLVITKDKSMWTRCPVFEMADEEVSALTEGSMTKFNMRWGTSKDKNGAEQLGSRGLSYFPGYAINMETGERLQIAFGEDSYLAGENGRDMIYNPTSTVINDNGNYPAMGGKHFIYILGSGYSLGARTVKGERYMGEDEANFQRFKDAILPATPNGTVVANNKRRLLSQIMWVIPTYLAAGYNMDDGVPPTNVKFTINVKKAYTTQNTGGTKNNERPMYSFNTNDIAPDISKENGKKSLDLVNIVPNPYRAYSQYENSPIDSRVKITNLPPECTITIYDMAGNFIKKFNKADEATYLDWDLKNASNVPISSGLYLIHIKNKDLGERTLRWYGIMHSIDLDTY